MASPVPVSANVARTLRTGARRFPFRNSICIFSSSSVANTKNSKRELCNDKGGDWVVPAVGILSLAAGVAIAYSSYTTRQSRQSRVQNLPMAREVWEIHFPQRKMTSVVPIIQRCGLMGRAAPSVKTELDHIRQWHQDHGYKGGLVLRDLSLPLFLDVDDQERESSSLPSDAAAAKSASTMSLEDFLSDPIRLARRECYYLYYEIKGDGQQQQQIFCRGTTILMDILTCLEAWMIFDPDLQCRVHRGFCNQADRILEDVKPLLAPPGDRRGTVEVCGHSLGGAVAVILAAKLRKRGYRVVRVTTVGAPRFCASDHDARTLFEQLSNHLRVEQELDFVTFLPPFGSHVGHKLWLVQDSARFVAQQDENAWADSVWTNFLAWEIFSSKGKYHRIPSYVESLQRTFSP